MLIDYSLYSAFWQNPDRCRLTYFKDGTGIVPRKTPDYFKLGGMFHKALELFYGRKLKNAQILKELAKDPEFDPAFLERAMRLFETFRMWRVTSSWEKIGAEMEFTFPLDDPKHSGCGKLDEVLKSGRTICVGEIKHQNDKKKAVSDEFRWAHNPQADFVSLGYFSLYKLPLSDLKIVITTITESKPPRAKEIEITRTKEQLEVMRGHILETARLIDTFREQFGDNHPWPHFINSYPCSMDRCEYGRICGKLHPDPKLLKRDFKRRGEHLEILAGIPRASDAATIRSKKLVVSKRRIVQ